MSSIPDFSLGPLERALRKICLRLHACEKVWSLELLIVHNHFRPGGVRRVIELATPHLTRGLRPKVSEVVLVGGEEPESAWLRQLRQTLPSTPLSCRIDPALSYLAELRSSPQSIRRRLRRFLGQLLDDTGIPAVVWAHNQGLGRNLLLTRELLAACIKRKISLVFHHHDWWFDNRWARWPEMRASGFRSLRQVGELIHCSAPTVRHVAINRADTELLRRHLGRQSGWLPNPGIRTLAPSAQATRRARRFFAEHLGQDGPVWLMPCRLLRRKNIAEALLLTRWLRPEAWLVTTGAVSSAEEMPYASKLASTARQHGWRLHLAILGTKVPVAQASSPASSSGVSPPGRGPLVKTPGIDREKLAPSVADLLAASEAVLFTSLQEGFGLPYLEAAASGRPLIARALPNVLPDLDRFGFRFPHCYDEVRVDPSLFDWAAERKRQRRLFQDWRRRLPAPCRRMVEPPVFLLESARPEPIAFSRLTLTAQLEVLSAPPELSWARCLPFNPVLQEWRELARRQKLRHTRWPPQSERWLGGVAYTSGFRRILKAPASIDPRKNAGAAAQLDFMRSRLAAPNLFPLTWSPET